MKNKQDKYTHHIVFAKDDGSQHGVTVINSELIPSDIEVVNAMLKTKTIGCNENYYIRSISTLQNLQ